MVLEKKNEARKSMLPNGLSARAARPDLTELAAAEFIGRHGRGGLSILEERAALADQLGHKLAAKTWRKIADAAARLLRTQRIGASLAGVAMPPVGYHALRRR